MTNKNVFTPLILFIIYTVIITGTIIINSCSNAVKNEAGNEVPVSFDMPVIFVNKTLFEKAGVPLPDTWEDVINSVPKFRALNIIPLVTNGLEGWPLSIFFDAIVQRINGDFDRTYNAITRTDGVNFTDPDFIQAASFIQRLVRARVFNTNLTMSDYGDAQYQFVNERAAMYFLGSWQTGVGERFGIPLYSSDNINVDNIQIIKFPAIRDGKGTHDEMMIWFDRDFDSADDLMAWLDRDFHKTFGLSAAGVESAYEFSEIILQFIQEATILSGRVPGLDYGNTELFKEEHQELMRQLANLNISPEDFAQKLDAATVDAGF